MFKIIYTRFYFIFFVLVLYTVGAWAQPHTEEGFERQPPDKAVLFSLLDKIVQGVNINFTVNHIPTRSDDDYDNSDKIRQLLEEIFPEDEQLMAFTGSRDVSSDLFLQYWLEKGAQAKNDYINKCVLGQPTGTSGTANLCFIEEFYYHPLGYPERFFTDSEVAAAFQTVLSLTPKMHKLVEYDGLSGAHLYKSTPEAVRLKAAILTLSAVLSGDKAWFLKIFNQLSDAEKISFASNTNTQDAKSRIEPSDLLLHFILSYKMEEIFLLARSESAVKASLLSLLQKSIYDTFKTTVTESVLDDRVSSMSGFFANRHDNKVYLYCSGELEITNFISYYYGFNTSRVTLYNMNIIDMSTVLVDSDNGRNDGVVTCNSKSHKIELVPKNTAPLPAPKSKMSFSSRPLIEVLLTISLVDEMDATMVSALALYLETFGGYKKISGPQDVNITTEFEKAFPQTDIFVPVAHALDVNYFSLGSTTGVKFVYEREFNTLSGSKQKVKLTALFPKKNTQTTHKTYSIHDLANLMTIRHKANKDSQLIFNMSCGSEGNLATWTWGYREAINNIVSSGVVVDFDKLTDVPHVIAARNSFPTDSLFDFKNHLEIVADTVKVLGEGQTIEMLLHKLAADYSARPDKSYAPVYNGNTPILFSSEGLNLILTDQDTQTELFY